MRARRTALGVAVGAHVGALLLAGCGSSDPEDAKADPSAQPSPSAAPSASAAATAPATAEHGPAESAGAKAPTSTSSRGAELSAVSGTVTQVRDMTARLSAVDGSVAITWDSGTVIVDSVQARAADLAIGTCVLVLPPPDGPSPTTTAMTAALVRVVPSSPSCPPVPGASPKPGSAPEDGFSGSVTAVGSRGVIGSVSAVSRKGFTLWSRDDAKTRTVAVTTSKETVYRKAGEHPRSAVAVGRCATVWGKRGDGGRVAATRIRVSDPVDGACAPGLT